MDVLALAGLGPDSELCGPNGARARLGSAREWRSEERTKWMSWRWPGLARTASCADRTEPERGLAARGNGGVRNARNGCLGAGRAWPGQRAVRTERSPSAAWQREG